MPQITPINELLQMQPGTPVLVVSGTIDSIFEQNRGENTVGPWILQNIVIKDKTGKIKVKLTDRNEAIPTNARHKRITIEAGQRQDGRGTCGLAVKMNKNKNKEELVLQVTDNAVITIDGGEPAANTAPAPQTQQTHTQPQNTQAPAQQQQPAAQQPTKKKELPFAPDNPPPVTAPASNSTSAPSNEPASHGPKVDPGQEERYQQAVNMATVGLAKILNGYWLALQAAAQVDRKFSELYGQHMPSSQFQACTSSMFIKMDRDGLIDGLPPGDIEKYKPTKKD